MEEQIQNAIQIAFSPTSEQSLKGQAYDFLAPIRHDPAAASPCLSLFTKEPRLDEVVRHFSLEIVNNAVHEHKLDQAALLHLRDEFLRYIRQNYVGTDKPQDSAHIQNKLAQSLTYLFEILYDSGWETFFDDLKGVANGDLRGNIRAYVLYLRSLASVHDEIADQLVNTAPEKQKRYTLLKDLIRARDANKIALSWQEILGQWRALPEVTVELCLKTISRYVGWIDISLIVTHSIISPAYEIASQHVGARLNGTPPLHHIAIKVFIDIIGKKMQPKEKIDLIHFLNIVNMVTLLAASPSLSDAQGKPEYDTDMAEIVAQLVDDTALDIVRVLDSSNAADTTKQQAEQLLKALFVLIIRFLSDEFDEVCSSVISSVTEILALMRKRTKSGEKLPDLYSKMLPPLLDAVVTKTRYDDTSEYGTDGDDTDEAEFQELRKRLRVIQQTSAAIDEALFLSRIGSLVDSIFARVGAEGPKVDWRDVELGLYEMNLLGELAQRNGGIYHKKRPTSAASGRLIQMMAAMMQSSTASYPHPAIQIQYMEICVRHVAFFEQHSEHISAALQHFIEFLHSDTLNVRLRSTHLFFRFVKHLKSQISSLTERVINAILDLCVIDAKHPEAEDSDEMSSEESDSEDTAFNSQLHLFEAMGCMASVTPPETQVNLAMTIIREICNKIDEQIKIASDGDEGAFLQIHHLMMALGTFARGFSDWVPGSSSAPVAEAVSDEFMVGCRTILNALGVMNSAMIIRAAARFAFSRMIGVLGFRLLTQMMQWVEGFMGEESTKDDIAKFLRLLGQIIYGFKMQFHDTLDTILTPLLERVFRKLQDPMTGTDDALELYELRREYLNFLLVILGNNLEDVLVSKANQSSFETVISTIEHFAKDTEERNESKLALAVFSKMCSVWGGPDIPNPMQNSTSPSPKLPNFDNFMITRFSPLSWAVMTQQVFDPKEAQANRSIGEIAILQQTILAKTGQEYLSWLKDNELRSLGMQDRAINEYLNALTTLDGKSFKTFLTRILQQVQA